MNLKRNARGGLVAPQPGGYEREWWARSSLRFLFTDRQYGYPPAAKWAEKQPKNGRRS